MKFFVALIALSCPVGSQLAQANDLENTAPKFTDVARDANGKILHMNQYEADSYCRSRNQRLPTARDLAAYAHSMGAKGISKTPKDSDNKDSNEQIVGSDVWGNPDVFFYSNEGFRPVLEDDSMDSSFWSSSVSQMDSANAYILFGDFGELYEMPRSEKDAPSPTSYGGDSAVRCVEEPPIELCLPATVAQKPPGYVCYAGGFPWRVESESVAGKRVYRDLTSHIAMTAPFTKPPLPPLSENGYTQGEAVDRCRGNGFDLISAYPWYERGRPSGSLPDTRGQCPHGEFRDGNACRFSKGLSDLTLLNRHHAYDAVPGLRTDDGNLVYFWSSSIAPPDEDPMDDQKIRTAFNALFMPGWAESAPPPHQPLGFGWPLVDRVEDLDSVVCTKTGRP